VSESEFEKWWESRGGTMEHSKYLAQAAWDAGRRLAPKTVTREWVVFWAKGINSPPTDIDTTTGELIAMLDELGIEVEP
jgi:hypothetical protein